MGPLRKQNIYKISSYEPLISTNMFTLSWMKTQLCVHSLVYEQGDLAGTGRGGDDVPALADCAALLVFGQKVKHLVVVHLHH